MRIIEKKFINRRHTYTLRRQYIVSCLSDPFRVRMCLLSERSERAVS
jgi:hypothetical protein